LRADVYKICIFGKKLQIMPKTLRLRGKFKGYFFVLGIHHIFPSKALLFLGHLSGLSKWISKNKNIPYNDFYSKKFKYSKREGLFSYLIKKEHLGEAIDYLEFGVSKGSSFRWWVKNNQHPDSRFFGFDTFTGLPEAWGPYQAGSMGNNNEPPKIEDNRHSFYQGLFQQTLLPFLANYKEKNTKVIHMDADLYTATLYVLTLITPYLKKGDIILFDEFNVPMHEYKAFTEWVNSFYIEYEVLGAVNNYYQVAIRIL
jgi:hypothetical protein